MEVFGLRTDPVSTLKNILEEYPGGQLLAEALQNSEDARAKNFVLVLDCRHHAHSDAQLAGPGFVLLDDGNGFSPKEWKSLQMLQKSEKREYA